MKKKIEKLVPYDFMSSVVLHSILNSDTGQISSPTKACNLSHMTNIGTILNYSY